MPARATVTDMANIIGADIQGRLDDSVADDDGDAASPKRVLAAPEEMHTVTESRKRKLSSHAEVC